MAHKDWKGPGFYDCWDSRKNWKWIDRKDDVTDLADTWIYKKREGFEPPELPEPELPEPELENGVYWVVHVNGKRTIMSLVEGKWFWSTGIKCLETPLTVLGKIPIDPI